MDISLLFCLVCALSAVSNFVLVISSSACRISSFIRTLAVVWAILSGSLLIGVHALSRRAGLCLLFFLGEICILFLSNITYHSLQRLGFIYSLSFISRTPWRKERKAVSEMAIFRVAQSTLGRVRCYYVR